MKRAAALAVFLAAAASAAFGDPLEQARRRWAESPHGEMLERILPPTVAPERLPEAQSAGARLLVRYCVQCHHLPNPAMHEARRWPPVVERMVLRMRGKGNLGPLMADLMAGVASPSDEEKAQLLAYLRRHALAPLDPRRLPEVAAPSAEAFRLACSQCHALPDPARYRAEEWPRVVARMQENMEWMNRVIGTQPARGEPQLRVADILAFLSRYARREPRAR